MRRLLMAAILLAAGAGQATAQTVVGDRVRLGASPCVFTQGTGAPSGGADCDVYIRKATTSSAIYQNVNGSWVAIYTVTPAALTKVDSATNLKLTLGGTPATALLQAASITTSWSGQLALADGGTAKSLTAAAGGVVWTDADSLEVGAAGSSGQILRSAGTSAPAWSTATYPATASGAGTMLRADGTNWVASTPTWPNTAAAGKLLRGDGTNWIESTPTFPTASPAAGTYLRGDGTNWITSTLVLPNAATQYRVPWATATNTWGDDANLTYNGTTLAAPGVAQTYTSGWSGSGFTLNYNQSVASQSYLEVDRLNVRGVFSVYELLVHQIRATNGSIFVANTGRILTATETSPGSDIFEIATDGVHGFDVGDLIRAQRFTAAGGGGSVYASDMAVVTWAGQDTTHFKAARQSGSVPAPGMDYVRLGNDTTADRQGSIYLTADDSNAPYLNVLAGVDSFATWGTTAKTRARLGNLNGSYYYASDVYGFATGDVGETWLSMDATNGFRIMHRAVEKVHIDVSGNASFTGAVTAASGAIGGWAIGATSLADAAGVVGMSSAVTGGDDIRFWAGHATPASAPFRVTEAGALTATSGAIGGWTLGATSLLSGSGSTTVAMDSGGTNPAFYAGSATPASAPFRVTNAGALTATNAAIGAGNITIDSNGITIVKGTTGWDSTKAYKFTDASGQFGLSAGTDGAINSVWLTSWKWTNDSSERNELILSSTAYGLYGASLSLISTKWSGAVDHEMWISQAHDYDVRTYNGSTYGDFRLDGNFKVNATKFTVDRATGATVSASTITATSLFKAQSGTGTDRRGLAFYATGDATKYGSVDFDTTGGTLALTAGYATWGGAVEVYTDGDKALTIGADQIATFTNEVKTTGAAGAFTLAPRDGSGASWIWYNPTGDDLRAYNTTLGSDAFILTNAGAVTSSGGISGTTGTFGTTPSTSGAVRIPYGFPGLMARNATNADNIGLIALMTSSSVANTIVIGDGGQADVKVIGGISATTGTFTGATVGMDGTASGASNRLTLRSNGGGYADGAIKINDATGANPIYLTNASGDFYISIDGSQDTFKLNSTTGAATFAGAVTITPLASGNLTSASGVITSSSDESLKDRILPLTYGLAEVLQLRPIRYHWSEASGIPTGPEYGGFGAQQVEPWMPLAVSYGDTGTRGLNTNVILGATVNAITEIEARLKALEAKAGIVAPMRTPNAAALAKEITARKAADQAVRDKRKAVEKAIKDKADADAKKAAEDAKKAADAKVPAVPVKPTK